MAHHRVRIALFPLLAGVVLAACSSGGASSSTVNTTTTAAPALSTTTTVAAPVTTATTTTLASTSTTAVATSTTVAQPAFSTLGPGKYKVGVETVTIKDPTGARPLTVDVWFPLKAGVTGAPHDYTLVPGTYYRSPAGLSAKVSDIAADGPFPLVVYSHGSGGLRYIASYYTEVIASHGYVVIAPDHTGNTAVERLTGGGTDISTTAINRLRDVTFVLDSILNPTNPEVGAYASSIDPLKIAVTGHSFGGFTALALASGYSNSLGSVKPDSRVRAIVALAPAVGMGSDFLLSDANLAAIRVPTMAMVGTNDQTTPVDPNVTRLFKLGGASPLYQVQLKQAQHQSFTDICDYEKFLPTLSGVPAAITQTISAFAVEGCRPADMPIERAKSLTDTFTIRFLESVFRNGPAITKASVAGVSDVLFDRKDGK